MDPELWFDLNNRLLIVCYLDAQVIQVTSYTTFDLNRGHKVHYSDHGFNNRPFNDWAGLSLSNIGLVCYSYPNFALGMLVSSLAVKWMLCA